MVCANGGGTEKKGKVNKMKRTGKKLFGVMCALLLMGVVTTPADGSRAQAAKKKKVVIVYFSATGTTKRAAKKIQKTTKDKLIGIKASEPYVDADLDWTDDNSRVTKEHLSAETHRESSVRPEIKNLKTIQKEIKKADVVYIGYPIWWGEAPHIVYNMVENVNLKNKTVVPFCTSASSGVGKSASYLKKKAKISSKTKWLKGKNFHGVPSQKTVNKWVKKRGNYGIR